MNGTPLQFLRFVLVGAGNAAFSYALFAALLWAGLGPATALLVAYAAGIVFNYFTTGRLVFRHRGMGALARFVAAYGVIYLVNLALFHAVASLGASPLLAQAICLPPVAVFSFLLFKFRVFMPDEASAPAGEREAALEQRTRAALPWIALALVVHLVVLARFAVNAPVMDDYDSILGSLVAMAKAPGPAEWWATVFSLQNEHRAATTRLIPLVGYWFSGSVDFRFLALCGTLFMAGTFALIWAEYRREIPPLVAGAGAFLIFQWSYHEALLQASGALPHLGVVFFAFLALQLALKPGGAALAGCIAACIAAAFSQANGLVVLPIAAAGCLLAGRRWRGLALVAATIAVWGLYFANYVKPPGHPSVLSALDSPVNAARLFLVIVGGIVPSLAVAQAVGALNIAGVAWLAWRRHWRQHPVAFLWIAYVFASAAAVAAGRAGFGLFYGSRYAVYAALLMTLVLFGAASSTPFFNALRSRLALAIAMAVSLGITFVALPALREYELRASLLVESPTHTGTDRHMRFLGMNHPAPDHAARILEKAGALGLYSPVRRSSAAPVLKSVAERPLAARTMGNIDGMRVAGKTVTVNGWMDVPATVEGREILAHSEAAIRTLRLDAIVARQDVVDTLRRPELLLAGFRIVLDYDSEDEAKRGSQSLCLYAGAKGVPLAAVHRAGAACANP